MRRIVGFVLFILLALVPADVLIATVDTGFHAILREVPMLFWPFWLLLSLWVTLDGMRFLNAIIGPATPLGRQPFLVSLLGALNMIAALAALFLLPGFT